MAKGVGWAGGGASGSNCTLVTMFLFRMFFSPFFEEKKNKQHTFPCEKISPQSKAAGDVWDTVKGAGELPTRALV